MRIEINESEKNLLLHMLRKDEERTECLPHERPWKLKRLEKIKGLVDKIEQQRRES